MNITVKSLFLSASVAMITIGSHASDNMIPENTESAPSYPNVVTPGDYDKIFAPPSDAIVLFDGKSLDAWQTREGDPAKWDVESGEIIVKAGGGDMVTKQHFGDCQLHVEWMIPEGLTGESQGRGNSGVFLQDRYEVQVLDSYQNDTYTEGQAASIYIQHPPLVNAMQKQGKWNVYDIIFTAPRFKESGALQSYGTITVLHNGVVVQNHTMILGPTTGVGAKYQAHGKAPIMLQDHGNPVHFRNVWIREL